MTKEMAEYFTSLDNCSITVSLDGPKDIHDKNRVTRSNKGSFHYVMHGLKLLVDCMGEEKAKKSININAVITPPYSEKKLERINDFFNSIS